MCRCLSTLFFYNTIILEVAKYFDLNKIIMSLLQSEQSENRQTALAMLGTLFSASNVVVEQM
jgi:hypothetical protein